MQQINQRIQENHLAEITCILSMYRALSYSQIFRLYHELPEEKVRSLLKRLEKSGRLVCLPQQELLLCSKDVIPNPDILSAFWVLLDFLPELTYHTVSDFPVTLTFYTDSDGYDVIHIPEEKEILMNHALSGISEDAPRRLVIVDCPEQIPRISFPGISAFCTVSPHGKIQYYRKQGVT